MHVAALRFPGATGWSIAISIVAVLVTAGFCLVAYRRSGYRRAVGFLELLRLLIVTIGAVLFNQPEWIEEYHREEKPTVAIRWDASSSMETRDVVLGRQTTAPPMTRHEAIAPLTDPAAWKDLAERMNIDIDSFSPPREGRGSNLNEPLSQALENTANLRGIVLISDGDWNEGLPPVQAAMRLRLKGVP